jgi:hypothetical protein
MYTTYENRKNPHIAIHRDGCAQIGKNGGVGEGEYHQYATLADAEAYANNTGLPIVRCSFCNP